jgi:hypothetical protein
LIYFADLVSHCRRRKMNCAARAHALILGFITAAALVVAQPIGAQDQPAPRGIAFLHLKLLPGGAQLASFDVRPGRLKAGPAHAGERILLQVLSPAGVPLWEGTINDPQRQVVEHAHVHGDAGHRTEIIERTAPDAIVRVPFFEEGQVVRVLRVTPAAASAPAAQTLLGTFRLSR